MGRRAAFATVAGLVAARVAFACTDLGGLTEAPGSDAAVTRDADVTPEATTSQDDADVSDGGATEDAAPKAFCAARDAALCADFDDGQPLTNGWSNLVVDGDGGIATLTLDASFSPPGAVSFETPDLATINDKRGIYLIRNFTDTRLPIHLEGRALLEAVDPTDNTVVIQLELATNHRLAVRLNSTATSLQEKYLLADGGIAYAIAGDFAYDVLPDGQWHKVEIDVLAAAGAPTTLGTVTVRVDDKLAFGPQTLTSTAFTKVQAAVGIVYTDGPAIGTKIRWDDVLLAY